MIPYIKNRIRFYKNYNKFCPKYWGISAEYCSHNEKWWLNELREQVRNKIKDDKELEILNLKHGFKAKSKIEMICFLLEEILKK